MIKFPIFYMLVLTALTMPTKGSLNTTMQIDRDPETTKELTHEKVVQYSQKEAPSFEKAMEIIVGENLLVDGGENVLFVFDFDGTITNFADPRDMDKFIKDKDMGDILDDNNAMAIQQYSSHTNELVPRVTLDLLQELKNKDQKMVLASAWAPPRDAVKRMMVLGVAEYFCPVAVGTTFNEILLKPEDVLVKDSSYGGFSVQFQRISCTIVNARSKTKSSYQDPYYRNKGISMLIAYPELKDHQSELSGKIKHIVFIDDSTENLDQFQMDINSLKDSRFLPALEKVHLIEIKR